MPRTIRFFDTTLRDGEQTPGVSLSVEEKIAIARQLEKLRVDIIEAGFAIASPGDFAAVSGVARAMGPDVTVASLSRALEKDIDAAAEALKEAKRPRIHTFIATSDIHMKYKLKMTPDEVLDSAVKAVRYARRYVEDVQFSAEDAGRSDWDFLVKVVRSVIEAGATTVNIPDTVGYNSPEEFGGLIRYLFSHVDNIHRASIAVHCHNDLGLAVANSLAALEAGATQMESTINGLGERAGNASLEEIVMNITTRRDFYNVTHNIDTTQLYPTSRLVTTLTGVECQPNKAIVGANAFAHESGIHQHGMLAEKTTYEIMTPQSVGVPVSRMVLGKLSGRHAFAQRVEELGYTLDEKQLDKAFARFKELADRKKTILDADIEALINEGHGLKSNQYEIDTFQIMSGNHTTSTATIILVKDGQRFSEAATGNGPVEAAMNAINRITGHEYTLDSYGLRGVTEGSDALGEVTVKIHNGDGLVHTGRGVSTDVIEASIRAYVNAINKTL